MIVRKIQDSHPFLLVLTLGQCDFNSNAARKSCSICFLGTVSASLVLFRLSNECHRCSNFIDVVNREMIELISGAGAAAFAATGGLTTVTVPDKVQSLQHINPLLSQFCFGVVLAEKTVLQALQHW